MPSITAGTLTAVPNTSQRSKKSPTSLPGPGLKACGNLKIHTPLLQMTKAQIIQKGLDLGVDYSLTHSCYGPSENGIACGVCDSCLLRLKGFKEAGVPAPLKYKT